MAVVLKLVIKEGYICHCIDLINTINSSFESYRRRGFSAIFFPVGGIKKSVSKGEFIAIYSPLFNSS